MNRLFLLLYLLFLGYSAKAAVCLWNGAPLGNWSDPANWSCGQLPGINDTVQLNGKSVTLNDSVAIQSLVLTQNCTIAGTGTLVVLGEMDLKNGGSQTFLTKIVSLGTLEAQGGTLNMNAKPFVIAGFAQLTQCTFMMNDGGVLEIAENGIATFHNGANFYCFHPYFGFVVRGTMYQTGSSNLDFEALYLFENANIHIQSGYLVNYYLENPVRSTIRNSAVHIASGAFLRIERNMDITNSTIAGPGKIWIGIGNCQFLNPNTVLADIEQRDGICSDFNGVDTLANYDLFKGFMLTVTQVKGRFNWNKGTIGDLTVQGFTHIYDIDPFTTNQKMLAGTLTVKGGGMYTGNDQLAGSVHIPLNTLFSLDAQANANFAADLQVFGTLRKMNTETVNVGFVINRGRIEGIGTLNGTIASQGTLAPGIGAANGTLTLSGPNLLVNGMQKIEIQVSESGGMVTHDMLHFNGRAKLDGALILLESGNAPPGDYVVIQATDSLTGNFDQLALPPHWEMIQQPFQITLRKWPSPPTAQFSIQSTAFCAPASLQFQDASSGSELQYDWTFPGGTPATSTEKNPVVTYDQPGVYTATLNLSNLLGASDTALTFTVYGAEETNLEASICAGDSIGFNGQYYYLPGVYEALLATSTGCDSLVRLQLSFKILDFSVNLTDSSLVAAAADATFQWYDCDNGIPVPGATNAVFEPETPGYYALIITQQGCTEISACLPVGLVKTNEPAQAKPSFKVWPNPADTWVEVSWGAGVAAPQAVGVLDMQGRQLARFEVGETTAQTLRLSLDALPAGACFLVLERDGVRLGGQAVMIGR